MESFSYGWPLFTFACAGTDEDFDPIITRHVCDGVVATGLIRESWRLQEFNDVIDRRKSLLPIFLSPIKGSRTKFQLALLILLPFLSVD